MKSSACSGRKPRIMASSSSLPQNTITDILSRLPVKSLTRFKSVSKNWAHLTSSPAFLSAHLRRSSPDSSLLIRRYHTQSGSDFGICLINHSTHSYLINQLFDIPLPEPAPRFPKIVGSVNGLVCLDVSPCYGSDFVLWNPATKEFKHLPFPLMTSTKSHPIWLVFLGFGFDSINKDYKLVRIVAFKSNDALPMRVEVYSWKKGVWKELEESFDLGVLCGGQYGVLCGGQYGVFADGTLNWAAIGLQRPTDRKFAISFEIGREVFKPIPLPAVSRFGNVKVMSYMGSLAVAVYPLFPAPIDNDMNQFEFWVFSDCDDGMKRWANMVVIPNIPKSLVPMATWRDRVLVIKHVSDGDRENHSSLLVFDPVDKRTERLPIDCDDSCFQGYSSYVESLVSVNG